MTWDKGLMKNSYLSIFVAIFISTITLMGCDKDRPLPAPEDTTPKDTTYLSSTVQNPQQKIVLLEEFTGVYCYTCPATHQVVADIIQLYSGKVATVNTHSTHFGIYSDPTVMGNQYDFRTQDGDSMVTLLGGVISLPSAAIDRKTHTGETTIISQNRDLWESFVAQEINEAVPVNIEIANSYSSSNRKLQVVITLNYVQNVSETNFLSVLFVENNIIDKQLDSNFAVVQNYSHQHILRDYLTDYKGNQITPTKEPGRVYIKVFDYTIPSGWNENNTEVIAFVHESGGSFEISQVAIKPLKN